VIGRQGMLMRRLERQVLRQARRDKVRMTAADVVFRVRMDPGGFAEVKAALASIRSTAATLSDEGLPRQFRQPFLKACDEASALMAANKWPEAKEKLKEAAALI